MARLQFKNYAGISLLARKLRKHQTHSELVVWNILRRRKLSGFRFLRQHPIFYTIINNHAEFYIADFYCAELRLMIEVDGGIHNNQLSYDKERDSRILEKGIKVVRIKNDEVNNEEEITAHLNNVILARKKELIH